MKAVAQISTCAMHAYIRSHHGNFGPEDCEGMLITRRSVHGCVSRSCEKAWTQTWEYPERRESNPFRKFQVDLNGWQEVLGREEL